MKTMTGRDRMVGALAGHGPRSRGWAMTPEVQAPAARRVPAKEARSPRRRAQVPRDTTIQPPALKRKYLTQQHPFIADRWEPRSTQGAWTRCC